MKRKISLFLAVAVVVTSLVGFANFKGIAANNSTSITFDPKPTFYDSGALSSTVSVVDPKSGYANGNALKFTKIVKQSTANPPIAVICDTAGTGAFSVEPNVEYTFKFDVLNRVCQSVYNVGFVLLDDGYSVSSNPNAEKLISDGKLISLYTFQNGNNKSYSVAVSFSADKKCKLGLVIYLKDKNASSDRSNQLIFFDNISIEPRVAKNIINTYDDAGIEFKVKDGVTYFSSENSADKDFTNSMAEIVKTTDPDGKQSNALHYFKAQNYNWQWPAIARIYDNDTLTPSFIPMGDTAFEISFDYRVDKKPSTNLIFQVEKVGYGVGNPNNGYNIDNIYNTNVETITGVTNGWQKAKALFYTKDDTPLTLTLVSSSSSLGSMSVTDVDVYVDNIRIKERLDTYKLTMEPNNGKDRTSMKKLQKEPITAIPAPTKSGCLFAGWYLDEALTTELTDAYSPTKDTTVYAKWIEKADGNKSVSYGFESKEDFPFVNTSSGSPVSGNLMNKSVVCRYDDAANAYGGKGYLRFSPEDKTVGVNDDWMVFTLIDKDGNPYQLSPENRYEFSYSYKFNSSLTNTIALVTSGQVASQGVNGNNSNVILSNSTSGPDKPVANEWAEYKDYFSPSENGIAKLIVYNLAAGDSVDIDDLSLKIMPKEECSVVNYYYVDQNGDNKKSVAKRVGPPGSFLLDANNQSLKGYVFNGWRDANGKQYLSSFFPNGDLDLFASWKPDEDIKNAKSDFSSDMLIDFDDSENAKPFYERSKNTYNAANGTYLVVGDKENAHSGSNYLMFKNCGHWMKEYYRSFKLYDKNSVGNQVYLEPNTAYKVSFWIDIEMVDAANLFLTVFNGGTEDERAAEGYVDTHDGKDSTKYYEVANENYLNEASVIEQIGKWTLVENTVITGEDTDGDGVAGTLGFVLQGGYLTARIDDIKIIKRKDITVSFDSMGGSEVSPIEMLSYDTVICPEDPVKDGFEFKGWFTDKAFLKEFDFINTILSEDITLYALWMPITPKSIIKKIIGYDTQQSTVDVDTYDEALDGQISIGDNDKIGKTASKDTESESSFNIIPYIIIGVIVLAVLAGAFTVILILKKKRRNKNEN